jgi:hypothetical protein
VSGLLFLLPRLISLAASADLTAVGDPAPNLTALVLSGILDGIQRLWISVFLLLCKLLYLELCLRAFSSTLFLLSFHVRIPKGFYPSYPAISTVVLAINDKHTLLVKHLPTICLVHGLRCILILWYICLRHIFDTWFEAYLGDVGQYV